MIKSILIAFSMFSKIKMPQFVWEEKNYNCILMGFPFVGLAIAGIMSIIIKICIILEFSRLFTAIISLLIPIFLTGGIHLDGFIDTFDALSSNQKRSKKIEILSDPHIGAFAIIAYVTYILMNLAVFYELSLENDTILMFFIIFSNSRSISAITLLCCKKSKNDGLANTFTVQNVKSKNLIFNVCFMVISIIFAFYINYLYAIALILSNTTVTFWWLKKIVTEFGGTTGDLQGFLLQMLEILMFFSIVLVQKVV